MHPIIYFFHKLVEAVNALGMEEYGSQFRIGAGHDFWKNESLLMGQENTQKLVPKPFLTHVFHFLSQLELAGAFPSRFYVVSSFSPWMETCFCITR